MLASGHESYCAAAIGRLDLGSDEHWSFWRFAGRFGLLALPGCPLAKNADLRPVFSTISKADSKN